MTVRDEYVTLDRLRFHYRDWESESARTLVLLHGFTGHARTWDRLASAMTDRHRVLALDQRGHGESEWAPEYGTDLSVGDVEAFATALGIERFDLLGLSMGGRNAYTYASCYPQRVERLVIVDIGPAIGTTGGARIAAAVQARDVFDSVDDAYAQMRAGNARADETLLRERAAYNLIPTEDGRLTWRYDKALKDPVRRAQRRPDPASEWETLRAIRCPVLLVRGGESDVLVAEAAERMVREIPDCMFVEIPGSGHTVPLDAPTELERAVRAFLS